MRVVVTSSTVESEDPVLRELGECPTLDVDIHDMTQRQSWHLDDFRQAIRHADVLISANEYPLDESTLDDSHQLRLIALNCSGTNHVDIDYLNRRGIVLCNTGSVSTEPVSEFLWAQVLNLQRKVQAGSRCLADGRWNADARHSRSLGTSIVGVVGFGAIGRRFVEKGRSLCRSFLVYRRSVGKRFEVDSQLTFCPSLEEVLQEADILVLACPLNNETRGLIGSRELSLMPRHGLLINAMRGEIVNLDALIEALENGEIGGAALDVFDREPISADHPLLDVKGNLLLTPHLAGLTEDAVEAAAFIAVRNAIAFSRGEGLINVVEVTK